MNIQIFSAIIITSLIVIYLIKKHDIKNFISGDLYCYCLVLMLVGILNYPTMIQYALRTLALAVSWLVIIFKTRGKISLNKKKFGARIIVPFILCAYISAIFSSNIIESLVKVTEVVTDYVLLCQIYKYEGHGNFVIKTYKILYYVCLILLIITAFGFVLVPSVFANTGYSASNSLLGIRIGNGIIGANTASAFAVVCLTWVIFIKEKVDFNTFLVVAVCAYIMLFSQSRASLIMIPIMILLRLFKSNSKQYLFYIFLVIVGIGAVFYYKDLLLQYILRGQTSEQLQGMSGRVNMWKIALDYFHMRPILGYGYGVGGSYVSQYLPGAFKGIQHMHNGFVETLVDTGIIGLSLLMLQVLYYIGMVIHNTLTLRVKKNMIDLLLLAYFIIRSITSLGFGNWHSMELILWYYMLLSIRRGKSIQIMLSRCFILDREIQMEDV